MTAIGVVCLVFSAILSAIDDKIFVPDWVMTFSAILFFGGAMSLLIGVFTFLWRVMP